jgi:hypothetical protein
MRPIDKINKRKNLYLTLVAIGFAVLVGLIFIENQLSPIVYKTILYSGLAIFGVGNLLLYVGIRCPLCKSIIGYVIVFSAGKADQCPRCKENLYRSQ